MHGLCMRVKGRWLGASGSGRVGRHAIAGGRRSLFFVSPSRLRIAPIVLHAGQSQTARERIDTASQELRRYGLKNSRERGDSRPSVRRSRGSRIKQLVRNLPANSLPRGSKRLERFEIDHFRRRERVPPAVHMKEVLAVQKALRRSAARRMKSSLREFQLHLRLGASMQSESSVANSKG